MSSGTSTPFSSTNAGHDWLATGASNGLPSRLPNQWMPIDVKHRSRLLARTARNRTRRMDDGLSRKCTVDAIAL